jgi:hypothetical protein
MPPVMPLPMPLKSLDIWVCWRRRLLTSWTVVPAEGDALAAAAVDDGGVVALLGGHGVDDGLDACELRLVDVACCMPVLHASRARLWALAPNIQMKFAGQSVRRRRFTMRWAR